MSARQALAVTHSAWINAWTLGRACAPLGVALKVATGRREMPLPPLGAAERPDWQLFTEEASLARALAGELPGRFLPATFPPELLDDKWAFAEFLAADRGGPQGLPQWPLADAAQAAWPLLLKGRHSWRGGRKLPRGWVCRDAAELAAQRERLAAEGLQESWFFLQAWLGDAPLRLLSVAGFFDAEDESRHLACVTERLADYGEGPSSSALLATVADERGLVERAAQVLRRLRYRGPYELEFIAAGDRLFALELNPRFWMQHGLFLAHGNGLLKRYFGLDTAADRAQRLLPPGLAWADGFWLLRRALRGDFAPWRRARALNAVICPPPAVALRTVAWRAFGGH